MHRKGHTKKRRTSRRKMRGGYYGATGAIAPGAMQWGTGTEVPSGISERAGNSSSLAGGRRRKGRKMTKRRKMRGGNKYGGVSASFQGDGTAGMGNYSAVSTRGSGGYSGGAFNDNGAKPGSTF